MPKVDCSTRRDREVAYAIAAWADFENLTTWRRSRKGNLWREWDGLTVSIFYRNRRYHWSIADGEETRFSKGMYADEQEAMDALGEVLGVGEA